MSRTAVFAGKAAAELLRIVVHVFVVLGIGFAMVPPSRPVSPGPWASS